MIHPTQVLLPLQKGGELQAVVTEAPSEAAREAEAAAGARAAGRRHYTPTAVAR